MDRTAVAQELVKLAKALVSAKPPPNPIDLIKEQKLVELAGQSQIVLEEMHDALKLVMLAAKRSPDKQFLTELTKVWNDVVTARAGVYKVGEAMKKLV